MKRNALTLVVGVILLVIFFLLLFTFQVRQTEVVVVTTFAKPAAEPITEPGLYFKWPLPIQKVYRFDKRIHNFEDEFEQMLTADGNNLLASVYVGWTIERPREFFNSFATGRAEVAEPQLKSLVRGTKGAVIGRHPFSDFVSSNPQQVKFTQVEGEILRDIKDSALQKYGVNIHFVGIKRLGIPENVTTKVFDRMTAERQKEIDRLRTMGESEKIRIQSAADRDRAEILSKAQSEALAIRGEADREVSKYFEVFQQNPELAVFLMQLQALESSLSNRSTIIANLSMPPFNMLQSISTNAPATPNRTAPGRREPSLSANEPTKN
jgi:modulator of FtsH protease HflC